MDLSPPRADDHRITRRTRVSADRTVHVVRFAGTGDVDDVVRAWLPAVYHAAGGDGR